MKIPIDKNCKIQSKPFVKWVGGKTQLLPKLLKNIPNNFSTYYEPFLGGGALFFNLQPKKAVLSDINPELINCYAVVKDNVKDLIEDLKQHHYDKDYFYKIRNIDRSPEFLKWSPIQKASRFIFLNKTCFNGLHRVNSKGQFNVPFGRYTSPKILDIDTLETCSRILKNTTLLCDSFFSIEDKVSAEDFVYFDPPYVPLAITSNFTSYSKDGFDSSKQIELSELCKRLNSKGVKFMLSNSSAPIVLELYSGFNIEYVDALRFINSKADKRGNVKEVIITNYNYD